VIPKPGDVIDLPEGRRLLVVSKERAAAVCKDVQLWWWFNTYGEGRWALDASPKYFRNESRSWAGRDFTTYRFAIEIAPPKEEYVPECQ